MKITIKCICGHERTEQIYGTQKQREKKIRFYEDNECPLCHNKSLKQQAETKGLPELSGTERQINWALMLREKHLDIIKKAFYDSKNNPQYLTLLQYVSKQTEAKTFIDAETSSINIIKYYIQKYKKAAV